MSDKLNSVLNQLLTPLPSNLLFLEYFQDTTLTVEDQNYALSIMKRSMVDCMDETKQIVQGNLETCGDDVYLDYYDIVDVDEGSASYELNTLEMRLKHAYQAKSGKTGSIVRLLQKKYYVFLSRSLYLEQRFKLIANAVMHMKYDIEHGVERDQERILYQNSADFWLECRSLCRDIMNWIQSVRLYYTVERCAKRGFQGRSDKAPLQTGAYYGLITGERNGYDDSISGSFFVPEEEMKAFEERLRYEDVDIAILSSWHEKMTEVDNIMYDVLTEYERLFVH